MVLRLSFIVLSFALLNGCSYGHGVRRVIDLDRELTDLSCIVTGLERLGYATRIEQGGVSYSSEALPVFASFSYAENNQEDLSRYDKTAIQHSVGFGSGPESCKNVKRASTQMIKIEADIFQGCAITVINVEEDLIC